MSDAEIPLWLNKLKSPKKRTSSVVSKSDDFDDASFLNPSTFEEKSSSSCKKQAQNGFICVLGDRVCPWEMKKTKSPSFPILTFPGRVHYLTLEKKVDKWCRRIPKGTIVGFDTEWKATFQKGVPQNRTALIQLCFERKFKLVCLLIQISRCGITEHLKSFLEDLTILKVGIAAENDAKKLELDYGISVNGVIEMTSLVRQKDLSNLLKPGKTYHKTAQSLEGTSESARQTIAMDQGLCERILGFSLFKKPKIQLSNWEAMPLSPAQERYAASDAYASLRCYHALVRLPDRAPTLSTQGFEASAYEIEIGRCVLDVFHENVPPLWKQTQLDAQATQTYDLFMGTREKTTQRNVFEICLIEDVSIDEVYFHLGDAVLTGRGYDWHRLPIRKETVHEMAAKLLQCLTDRTEIWRYEEKHRFGHPLARVKRNTSDLRFLKTSSLIWHLATFVCVWNLYSDEKSVVDFRIVLYNAGIPLDAFLSFVESDETDGLLYLIVAHLGRQITDLIHRNV